MRVQNNKSNKIKFSIIMCVYNVEQYIETAIKSVLSQKYNDFELIIVDDASYDKTLKIAEKYKNKSDKINIYKNKKNLGLSQSRNLGVSKAKGEYIMYLDGDDTLYEKDTLIKIDKVIGENTYDILYFGIQYVGGDNKMYLPNEENSTQKARIACDMFFGVVTKVWNKKFLKVNKLKFIKGMYYEDMVYSIKATIKAKNTTYGSFPIYNYYKNRTGSIMSTPNIKRCKDMYKMLYYLMELYEETPEELKPYLLSFIKNETLSIPMRLDIILDVLEKRTTNISIPKRNYVFNDRKKD